MNKLFPGDEIKLTFVKPENIRVKWCYYKKSVKISGGTNEDINDRR